jgi:2,3-bisphosphoglycerate-independent phosphoglycerate mutase
MTTYGRDFGVPALFPNEDIRNTLGEVIAANEFLQLRIAEAEKYAHVTYFMNGYREAPFPNEYRVVVPSGSTVNYAESPGMQTPEIANRVVSAITDRGFDFIIANLANTDLVAHTGNFDAAVEAVRVADEALGRIVRAGLEHGTTVLVTADHGHIERLVDPLTGRPEATHSTSLVPCYVADVRFASQKSLREAEGAEREAVGILSDIAPTILDILGIQKPAEMTGESLLGRLS